MLIPSIDLQNGRIVQLIQGETLALATDDIEYWIERFRRFPIVQLIDLDAAKSVGHNHALVRRIAAELPCRVGGGIRTIEQARDLLDAGARQVIVGSRLFRDDVVDVRFAASFADAVGATSFIAAVDSRGGQVLVDGWKRALAIGPVETIRAFEPFCREFLYTHVDTEGLLGGIDLDAVRHIRAATSARLTAAGGITTREEIEALDAMQVDAVVGMAIYKHYLDLE
jgi:phosphoribosylformimino-5-aminoimidazole carboxamide ribotide isomerase